VTLCISGNDNFCQGDPVRNIGSETLVRSVEECDFPDIVINPGRRGPSGILRCCKRLLTSTWSQLRRESCGAIQRNIRSISSSSRRGILCLILLLPSSGLQPDSWCLESVAFACYLWSGRCF